MPVSYANLCDQFKPMLNLHGEILHRQKKLQTMYIPFKMTAFNVTVNVTTPLSRETVVIHNVRLINI